MVRSVLRIVFDNDDQGVLRVGAVSRSLNQQADSVVIVCLLEFRSVDSPQGRAETARVIVAQTTDHLQRGQIAVRNELLELAVPLVEAPKIWVDLIVSAEVRIIEAVFKEKLIGRGGLDDASGERIGDGVCDCPDTPRGVGHPAVVTNSSPGVQDRVEDVPLLITCRAVGGGMVTVPVAGQDVRGAALQRRSGVAIRRGCAGWIKEKVAGRNAI